jgi:hypothetical protein
VELRAGSAAARDALRQGVTSQWNGATIDWSIDVDPENWWSQQSPPLAKALAATLPAHHWRAGARTSSPRSASDAHGIAQPVHARAGAMLTAAKLVEAVPWIDANHCGHADGRRRVTGVARYLRKLGDAYPMAVPRRADSRPA